MWEIQAYQNADSLFGVFHAMAAIHASQDYAAALAADKRGRVAPADRRLASQHRPRRVDSGYCAAMRPVESERARCRV
jgi:hypothetical protein